MKLVYLMKYMEEKTLCSECIWKLYIFQAKYTFLHVLFASFSC